MVSYSQDPFNLVNWKPYILSCTKYKKCKKLYKGNIRYKEYIDDLKQYMFLEVLESISTYDPNKKTKNILTCYAGVIARVKYKIPKAMKKFFNTLRWINENEKLTLPRDLNKFKSKNFGPYEFLLFKEYHILAATQRHKHGR